MRVVELFAGVGGFRLGLERNGHEIVWANEWDRWAADTYDKNFAASDALELRGRGQAQTDLETASTDPIGQSDQRQPTPSQNGTHRINRADITTVDPSTIPAHDLICGGFPCQAFSVAGKRRGFDETRGTLFFEIMRIARHHRTKYLFLENVKGLLSHDQGRTFETILGSLDESGYDCQWQVLNSKDFGVPQNRERVFIIGHLTGVARPQVFPILDSYSEIEPQADFQAEGLLAGTIAVKNQSPQAQFDASTTLISDGQTGRQNETSSNSPGFSRRTARTVRSGGVGSPYKSKSNWDSYDIGGKIRRLTPIECERLQGFPDNWTAGVSDTQRYKQMGNAVTINVIEAIGKKLCLTN